MVFSDQAEKHADLPVQCFITLCIDKHCMVLIRHLATCFSTHLLTSCGVGGLEVDQLAHLAAARSRRMDCDTVLQEVERNHPGELGRMRQIARTSAGLTFSLTKLYLNVMTQCLCCCCLVFHCMHIICCVWQSRGPNESASALQNGLCYKMMVLECIMLLAVVCGQGQAAL